MAMTGVLRPGHVQIRVLDLEEGVRHYRDIMGLEETGRDAQGRVYLKCWDEMDHSSVILRQADRAGLDFAGYKVLDKATLEKLDADLRAYGVKTERIPAGEMLETGERVRFEIPSGHLIELYAEKTAVGNGLTVQPILNMVNHETNDALESGQGARYGPSPFGSHIVVRPKYCRCAKVVYRSSWFQPRGAHSQSGGHRQCGYLSELLDQVPRYCIWRVSRAGQAASLLFFDG